MRIAAWTLGMALGVLALGSLPVASASAASLTVNGYVLGDQVYVLSAARTGWVRPAELDVTIGGTDGFSYCVDLQQTITTGSSSGWTIMDAELNPSMLRAAWLVEYARPRFDLLASGTPGATRATLISALQVSIWEVLGDSAAGYDLYDGAFSVRSDTPANVMNLARGFLGALGGADLAAFQTSAVWAQHGLRQDQLVSNPIPEPSSIALFAAGIGSVAYVGTRKRA